jgi:hypothetical protein
VTKRASKTSGHKHQRRLAFNNKMKASTILLLTGLLCACTKTGQEDNTISKALMDIKPKPELTSENKATHLLPESIPTEDSTDSVQVLLQFDNLILTTWFEEVWNDENYFAKVHSDTILVKLGLVTKISGQYSLKPGPSIQAMEILQSYETSVTIMDEGPHVDLTKWKHHIGEWKKLNIVNNTFRTHEYSSLDQEKFPDVTTDEIVQATKKHFNIDSNGWTELAQKCTGPNSYPCGVSISRIIVKIILTDNNGITSEKYIILEVPMGC